MKTLEQHLKESWDDTYKSRDFRELPWETVKPDKELIGLLKGGKIKKCKVLDMGCGAGTNSIYLAQNRFEVTGVDISPTAIIIAKNRAKEANVEINFLIGNAYSLKLPKKSFDFIFDRGCFHHIPIEFRNAYVKQNYGLLKDNGKYYLHAFSDSNDWHQENLFSLEKISSYFIKYFEFLETKEMQHNTPNGEKVYLRSVFMSKI